MQYCVRLHLRRFLLTQVEWDALGETKWRRGVLESGLYDATELVRLGARGRYRVYGTPYPVVERLPPTTRHGRVVQDDPVRDESDDMAVDSDSTGEGLEQGL